MIFLGLRGNSSSPFFMSQQNAPLSSVEILILEDEPLLRKRLAASLERYGAEVTVAESVQEARNCLESMDFDFAMLDVHLPDGNGLELLRSGAFVPDTGVIVMTAEGGVETAVEASKEELPNSKRSRVLTPRTAIEGVTPP